MNNHIEIYQNGEIELDISIQEETIWLTQKQILELFDSSKANISEHIKAIFDSNELNRSATVRKFRTVQNEGGREVARNMEHYNLDVNRNFKRFMESFIFQVTNEKYNEILRCQVGTSSIGASLKDLGKKWFAFSKMDEESFGILERLK